MDRNYATKIIYIDDDCRVRDASADEIRGLTSEQADKVERMLNRAYKEGYKSCGKDACAVLGLVP